MSNDESCKKIDTEDQKKEGDQPAEKSTKKSSSPWSKMEKKKDSYRKTGWGGGFS